MIAIILVFGFGLYAYLRPDIYRPGRREISSTTSEKLDKLWVVAQQSFSERKYLRAEKVLLTILRVDERNATAYNRLGILYAKQQAFKDAIECFEIAQSLEPSASSLHNVGLIYYETGKYDKAALAFEQALAMEADISSRHIAYAKVQEKLGDTKKMVTSLEKAVEIDPVPQTLNILADAYERIGDTELAASVREESSKLLIPSTPVAKGPHQRKIRQARKTVM